MRSTGVLHKAGLGLPHVLNNSAIDALIAAVQDRLTIRYRSHLLNPAAQPAPACRNMAELAESLRAHGVLQPRVVRRRGATYD